MNNDLISREALKKELKEAYAGIPFSLIECNDLIDNAPTVFSCNACKNMGNEWECRDCHDYSNYIHYEERPQGDLADEVWKLYEKHQSHLATNVLEFGDELKELLDKYQKGGAECTTKHI